MSQGGIVYFRVNQNGKPLSCDEILDKVSMKRREELEKAIRKHFNKQCPAIVSMQVEFNDYGCLVDFSAEESIEKSIPSLDVISGKQTFTVMFDKVSTKNNNSNMNGGRSKKTRRAKRSAKRSIKGTRRN